VELTVALLHVFEPPKDKILWDVSHQVYAYKMLTERKNRMDTIRQYEGLSGFSKRSESPYDAFGAGHAGTALSAALGMAVARDRRGEDHHVMAVVGDASACNGITFEALNNVSGATKRLIVILNDNKMSISANVGGFSRYMGRLLANPRYNHWKRSVETLGKKMSLDWFRGIYYRMEEAVKSLFLKSVMFEELGLRYIGPVDGHNLTQLVNALTIAKNAKKPILLHVATQKGRGYSFAEELPEKWHGTPSFDIASGQTASGGKPGYSAVFGKTLETLAAEDDRIVAITAAMSSGTGLSGFSERFPERFFDVGISEEHGAVFAAGLAAEGFRPVFAVYSTFAQRIVDCVIHDICLQNLPVVLCLDRAGIVGDDGPTHHGVFDLALLAPIPGLMIMQPRHEAELADMLYTALHGTNAPVVIRYPRGAGPGILPTENRTLLETGRAEVVREGHDVQIWALGDMVPVAEGVADLLASDGLNIGVVNARFVRPLDEDLLLKQAQDARLIATLENGVITGGFGSLVEACLMGKGWCGNVRRFGWPDAFVPQGKAGILFEQYGLTSKTIADDIRKSLEGQADG
jgi:1-deoxy-D-xylulose-5-phosphate synthase